MSWYTSKLGHEKMQCIFPRYYEVIAKSKQDFLWERSNNAIRPSHLFIRGVEMQTTQVSPIADPTLNIHLLTFTAAGKTCM